MLVPKSVAFYLVLAVCLCVISFCSQAQSQQTDKGPFLLVANQGDRTLSIISASAATQVAAVPEGDVTGHEVAASPDGKTAYVPIYGNSGVGKAGTDGTHIVVIDIASRKVTGNIDLGHGARPHCILYNKHDGLLYVTTELDKAVTIIDPNTLKVVGTIPTGQPESHMLAISHSGERGYTSNVGPGTVSVLDMKTRKTITLISISPGAQRISISNDDSMVFTSDQTKARLAVIDTATNKIKTWVDLPGVGYGTASTKDGKLLLVAMPSSNKIAVVDLSTLKVVRTINVPSAPQEILVRPDGLIAYVSCNASAKVAAIDLKRWEVETLINAGVGADGLAWTAKP